MCVIYTYDILKYLYSQNAGITLSARVQTQINIQIDDFSDIEQTKGII